MAPPFPPATVIEAKKTSMDKSWHKGTALNCWIAYVMYFKFHLFLWQSALIGKFVTYVFIMRRWSFGGQWRRHVQYSIRRRRLKAWRHTRWHTCSRDVFFGVFYHCAVQHAGTNAFTRIETSDDRHLWQSNCEMAMWKHTKLGILHFLAIGPLKTLTHYQWSRE